MATRGSVNPYRQLSWAVRPTPLVPRRTITFTRSLRAEEEGASKDETPIATRRRSSPLSSIKDFFLGGGKSSSKPQITRRPAAPQKREGSLSSDSIFAEDEAGFKLTPSGRTPSRQKVAESDAEETQAEPLEDRMPERMQLALDPNPKARLRWERKMIIRAVRKRGRLTKEEVRLATERESSLSSHWFKTSVKKLGPLARQIAGKNIDEAIIQMRFSKKKAAKDVMEHLQHAKNVAVVRHGMGLGQMTGEESSAPEPVTVILKDGTKKVITDPASIYIAQAWVNRGPFDLAIDHRARGQANRLRLPHTGLSVILKEEKSRIREWQDREAKALRQRKSKLWVHLPDRKISAQNQYYSW